MKKNNIMSGALVLSVGAVLAKVFSAIYRIALTRVLGGVGIGIYQLIFPFYSLCVVLATAGLPMAISKVISKHRTNEIGVVKKCFIFTTLVASTITLILILSAKGLAILQGEKDITICYMILAPTILLVSFSSVLRGYFQGKHNFVPSSISNIFEQFVKLCVGLILSVSLVSVSLLAAIIGAVIGIVLSEVISLLILLLYIKKDKFENSTNERIGFKELLKDVVPITLNNIILPISTFVDSLLVVNLLSKNFSQNISVFLYGLESGAVSSLVSIPTIFSFAIASVILPNITMAKHNFNRNEKLSIALKIVYLITIPCVLCFVLVPNRLIGFLYGNKLNSFGFNGVVIASRLLSISGIGVVFLAINQVYSSCLQAIDERFVAIRNLTIGVVLKFIIEIVFMPSKRFNIFGLVIANLICYFTVVVLNHLEIRENFKLKIHHSFWAKLIFANCVMLFSLLAIMLLGNGAGNTLFAFIVAVIVYFLCLVWTKVFTTKDRAMLKYKV